MKALTLVSTLIAAAYAAPAPAEAIGEIVDWSANVNDAVVADPTQSTVNGEKVLPRFAATKPEPGLQRKTVKYGSYMVSSAKMMSTTKLAQGPCGITGCYVTAMEATIRYPDGKEANVDTNAWLHHIALFGSGAGGGSIWAAGNERPTLRLNVGGNKYGVDFPSTFMLMIDLMTEDTKPKNLTLEISYEFANKGTAGYKAARMYWLTIGEPAAKQGKFSFNTIPMSAGTGGKLLYAIGHMHDGGTDMTLYVSGRMVCKSIMHYNAREGYNPKMSSGKMVKRQHAHGAGNAAEHISDPGACTNFGTVAPGAMLSATANYDATKHGLMVHNGKAERLMGNMRVYVGP